MKTIYDNILFRTLSGGGGGEEPQPSGTLSIASNGVFDVGSYASADVQVPIPSAYGGAVDIVPSVSAITLPTSGLQVLSDITVEAIPSEYIIPSGVLSITSNGTAIDVTSLAAVDVAVSGGLSDAVVVQLVQSGGSIDLTGVSGLTSVAAGRFAVTNNGGALYGMELSAIDLPTGVETIGRNAFALQMSLSHVGLPSTVKTIEMYAFNACNMLSAINLANVEAIGMYAFAACYELNFPSLPSTLSNLSSYAFQGCSALTLADGWPAHLSAIPSGTFTRCISLSWTSLPSTITDVGANAFGGCTALALTSLPALSVINSSAFTGTALAITEIPSTVTSIGQSAFSNCTALAITELASTITSIGGYAFYHTGMSMLDIRCNLASTNVFAKCENLRQLKFRGASLQTASVQKQFGDCTNLSQVWLASTVTTIDARSRSYVPFINTAVRDIYLEADTHPITFQSYWSNYLSNAAAAVHYGVTEEQFDALWV